MTLSRLQLLGVGLTSIMGGVGVVGVGLGAEQGEGEHGKSINGTRDTTQGEQMENRKKKCTSEAEADNESVTV